MGRFEIKRELGAGGAAQVFLVHDSLRSRDVALKLLRRDFPADLLFTEFDRLTTLVHESLPTVVDFGVLTTKDGPRAYYTAEPLAGAPFAATTFREVRSALVCVARALRYLHRRGVVHGDVKADNVLVGDDGSATLIDLGCAEAIGARRTSVSGTRGAIAPEVAPHEQVDAREDLFAFGVLMRTVPDLPPDLASLAERCACTDRAERVPSMERVLEALGEPVRDEAIIEPALYERDAQRAALTERLVAREPLIVRGSPGTGRSRFLREARVDALRAGRHAFVFPSDQPLASLLAYLVASRDAPAGTSETVPVVFLDDVDARRGDDLKALGALRRKCHEGALTLVEAHGDPSSLPARASDIQLAPLSPESVEAWVGDRAHAKRLVEETGGYPREIRWSLLGLDARDLAPRTDALDASTRAALKTIAQLQGMDAHLLSARVRGALAQLIQRTGPRVSLTRPAFAEAYAELDVDNQHLLRACARSQDASLALLALAHISPHAAANEVLNRPRGELARDPRTPRVRGQLRAASDALGASDDAALRVTLALARGALASAQGDSPGAVAAFEDALAHRDDPATRLLLARCLLRAQRLNDAEDEAKRVAASESPVLQAGARDVLSRIAIQRANYQDAFDLAQASQHPDVDHETRARLRETAGVAASYLRRPDARALLTDAAELHVESGDPRAQVRALSYLGIESFRSGELASAAHAYGRALSVAEDLGLTDLLPAAALNCGTAHHLRGEWALAIASYSRGERARAQLTGHGSTFATLCFDLALLHVEIGDVATASRYADDAESLAAQHGAKMMSVAAKTVRAELLHLRGATDDARAMMRTCEEEFYALGAVREATETRLSRLALAAQGDPVVARALRDELGEATRGDEELRARLALAGHLLDDDPREALSSALAFSERHDHRALRARLCSAIARVWERRGGHANAAEHRQRARAAWEAIGDGLPAPLLELFWRHPDRQGLSARATSATSRREGHVARLERLLAVNRAISSSRETETVVKMAMDAAIELTGAERGFLVLRDDDDQLVVRAARNLDRERVGRSRDKLSFSVAERVIETGEPVLTVDASDDARFREQRSVHAMKLRSILAVPLPGRERPRGALYLDNRFRRGRFEEDDVALLMAFADQLAIALENAALVEELSKRTTALETERRRVEALSEGQAAQIEALTLTVRTQRAALSRRYDYGALVGRSDAMRAVLDTLDRVIDSRLSVLVSGASGTGKELVARAIHTQSERSGAFIAINCAALPDSLLESELFGHVRGAFSGADRDREGLVVAAEGGTLFLDELGEMSLGMQAKLLRLLETKEVRPVGGSETRKVDFRLVCATNRELEDEVQAKRFREDLFYRVGVVRVRLPALRERRDDIPELTRRLLNDAARENERPPPRLTSDALSALLRHDWPGNVRQLANVLRAAMVMCDGDVISREDLTLPRKKTAARTADDHLREEVRAALEDCGFHVTRAAARLGISRATMYRRLKRLGIKPPRAKVPTTTSRR